MDRRRALEISSADSLAAWVDALVRVVHKVREDFAARFPIGGSAFAVKDPLRRDEEEG